MNVSSGEYTCMQSELISFGPSPERKLLFIIEAENGIKQHRPLGFKCFGLFLEGMDLCSYGRGYLETYDTPLNCISNTFECLFPFNSLDQIVNSPL